MKYDNIKERIARVFLDLLNRKNYDKITVKEIVDICKINRNTFYYYFEDINCLLNYIFEKNRQEILGNITGNEVSFYDEYIFSAAVVLNYRQAVIHIYQSSGRYMLEQHIEEVTRRHVKHFVIQSAKGYPISDTGITYVANFYTYALVGNTLQWISEKMPPYREKLLKKISESFNATIDNMIKDWIEKGNTF